MDTNCEPTFVMERIVSAVKADTAHLKTKPFAEIMFIWICEKLDKVFSSHSSMIQSVTISTSLTVYNKKLAEMFCSAINCKSIGLFNAVSVIWRYVGHIELLRNDSALIQSDDTLQYLLASSSSIREFFSRTIETLCPLFKHLGTVLVDELVASKFVQRHLPHLIPKLTGSDDINSDQYTDRRLTKKKNAWSTHDSSLHFKLPESFTIPFNEETDSRNNYKSSQMEVSIYNERQSCLDRIKDIFREYERQPTLSNFKETLLPQCISLLSIKECNVPYLADIFVKMILFYGLKGASSSPASSSSSSGIATAPAMPAKFAAAAASKIDILESRMSGVKTIGGGGGGGSASTGFGGVHSRPAAAGESTIGFGATAVAASSSIVSSSSIAAAAATGPVGLSYANMAKVNQLSKRLGGGGPDSAAPLMPPPGLTVNTAAANSMAGFGGSSAAAAATATATSVVGFGGQTRGSAGGTSFTSIANQPASSSSSGGGSAFGATFSTAAASKTTTTTSSSSAPVTGYDVYARVVSSKKTPAGAAAAAAAGEPDLFEGPSQEFPHLLQFFFRFLIHADNYRFNCCLMDALTAEVMSLLKPEGAGGSSSSSNNHTSGSSSSAKKLPGSGTNGQNSSSGNKLTLKLSSAVDFSSLSPENFAILVCKLRLLGRFLGLLRNYPRWTLTADLIQSRTLLQQSCDTTERQLQLAYSLPIENLLEQSYHEGSLALYVSWMVPYFKMSQWDSSVAHCSSHTRALDCLLSLLNAPQLSLPETQQQTHHHSHLSTNRLYLLMELQSLQRLQKAEYSPLPFAFSGGSGAKMGRSGVDEGNQAFSTWFLHHVTPELEVSLNLLRQKNKEAPAVTALSSTTTTAATSTAPASAQHKIAPSHLVINNLPVKPKQRAKTPLETVAENSVSILSSHPSSTCLSPTLTQSLTSPKHSALNPKKSSKKSSPSTGATAGVTSLNSSTDSIHSLSALAAAGSFASASAAATPAALNQFHSISTTPSKAKPPMGLVRSSSTPTKSPSPRKTRSGSNTQLSALGRAAVSPSPIKRRASSLTESLYDAGENALASIQLTDIKERLETAFWEQHQRLQKVAELSLDHAYHACRAHIKDQAALYAQELIAHINTLKIDAEQFAPQTRNDHFKASIQEHMTEYLPLALEKGKKFIENFYGNFIETVLPALCVLYPVQERVVGLALRFATEQSQEHKEILLKYFQEYCQGKFKEMCDVVIRQYANEHHGRADVIVDSEGVTLDLRDESELTMARTVSTVQSAAGASLWSLEAHQKQLVAFLTSVQCDSSLLLLATESLEMLTLKLRENKKVEVGLLSVQSITQFRNSVNMLLNRIVQCVSETTLSLAHCQMDSIVKEQCSLLLTALSQLLCALVYSVSQVLTSVIDAHCEHICSAQELRGKIGIEVSKFLTSLIPHLIFLNRLHARMLLNEEALTLNAVSVCSGSAGFSSDLINTIISVDLLSVDGLLRLLPSVLKAKTCLFYESCKHLSELREYVSEGVLFLLGRLLFHRHPLDSLIVASEAVWFKEVSVMDLIRSTESEGLVKFVAGLAKTLH